MSLIDFSNLLPKANQTFSVDAMTIIFGIILIICIVKGAIKGFGKSFMGLIFGVGSFVAAYFLAEEVANVLVANQGMFNGILNMIDSKFIQMDSEFSTIITSTNQLVIANAISEHPILSLFGDLIPKAIMNPMYLNFPVSRIVAFELTKIIFVGMGFILVLIASGLIVLLIKLIFRKVKKPKIPKVLDVILGLIFGIFEGLVVCSFVCVICYYVLGFNLSSREVAMFISDKLFASLGDNSVYSIAKVIFETIKSLLLKINFN